MTDPYLHAVAERELRDALLRYLARIRQRAMPLTTVYQTWAEALSGESDLIQHILDGAARHEGSIVAYAAASGYDVVALGRRGAAEIERVAQVMELVDERTQDDD